MKQAGVLFGCRIAILLWASLWMLAIPLFHVHPAVNHRHGGAVHAYGVTVHTVLSVDLDGEFDDHHDVDSPEESTSRVSLFDHHSHSLDQHPEVAFSLLNDSSDRKSFKPVVLQTLASALVGISETDLCVSKVEEGSSVRSSIAFPHLFSSRAPPPFLVQHSVV